MTGAQLTAGVDLFAEARQASSRLDDVSLTLTLRFASAPVGTPVTVTMTAVEVTLDIAVSRTTPEGDPAPLSAADKVDPGRLVQVRDPGHTHERAMLIVCQAQPDTFVGDLELQPLNAQLALYSDELPAAGQSPLPPPHIIPNGSISPDGARFFVEGISVSTAARNSGFQLGIRNLEADGDRVAITVVQIEITTQATDEAPAATFVRFGLWDNAFRADGTVFNDTAEADHFAGADTRRFHVRVRDVASQGSGHVDVDWRTVNRLAIDVDAPAARNVSLIETGANSGVFVSRALMLVTDSDDQNQGTHSGLPAGVPDSGTVRNRGQSNHRIRLGDVPGAVVAEYRAHGAILPLRLPHFQRDPESRRRMPLQVLVLRVAPSGAGVVATAPGSPIWLRDLPVVEETYARLGIAVETVVAPGTPTGDIRQELPFVQNENVQTSGPYAFHLLRTLVVRDPRNRIEVRPAAGGVQALTILYDDDPGDPSSGEVKVDRATGRLTFSAGGQPAPADQVVASYVVVGHQIVLIDAPAGVNPLAVAFTPTNDESTLGTSYPALPDTIRVFYTGGLVSGNAGESWSDANFAGQPQVGSSFINGVIHGLGTVAHEIGHLLTNKNATVNTGHYRRPASPAGNRLHDAQNLMAHAPSPAAGGVNIRKRLWDIADADGVNQFTVIRGSRFTRGF